jgi:hypothetical protein
MMPEEKSFKVAILWRGDVEARQAATPQNNRFHRVFEELAAVGIDAEPAVYDEDFAEEVRDQLLGADGVLVWVDPIHQGKTREKLDPLLRDVASRGPWVSAHPDVILKWASRRSSTAPSISAGARTRISIAVRRNFARRSRRGCRPARGC